jgi:cysteine desulfurase/selenocysteine lyase
MKMLLSYGTENVKKRIVKVTDHLIDSVKDLGFGLQTPEEKQCRSGIVNFRVDKPQQLSEKLQKKGIVVCARANGIRVSPHFYNTEEEIDRLTEEIKRLRG